jgi:hypothetical protein
MISWKPQTEDFLDISFGEMDRRKGRFYIGSKLSR